jgi:hypothetical protein
MIAKKNISRENRQGCENCQGCYRLVAALYSSQIRAIVIKKLHVKFLRLQLVKIVKVVNIVKVVKIVNVLYFKEANLNDVL